MCWHRGNFGFVARSEVENLVVVGCEQVHRRGRRGCTCMGGDLAQQATVIRRGADVI
jgi:hypothetical protein